MDENRRDNEIENSENTIEKAENVIEAESVGTEAPVRSFSENLTLDLTEGLHSVLYKKIGNLTIGDARIANVFSNFLKEVECGKSFRIIDILASAENVVKGGEPKENGGNLVYCYDYINIANKNVANKLLANSIGGLYSLIAVHNGIALDIDSVGSSVPAAESRRYLIIPPKKEAKFLEIARYNEIKLVKAGEIITENKIYLSRNNEIIATVDKGLINSDDALSVAINESHYSSFIAGYNAVCSLALCNCISVNNLVRFGLGGDIASICARALGIYSALTYLKLLPLRMVYTNEATVSVAVSRPNIADGDYLYMLKLRNDQNGLPDKVHYGQLYYYLGEKKKMNIIKDVLPIRENIGRVINRLSRADLEYVQLAQVPDNCFGVIVSVGRGESVNGVKLGYFKGIQ